MAKAKNEVKLIGRVSGGPKIKRLPSGDEVVEIRLVVERDNVDGVDTLDVATWSSRLRRRTLSQRSRVDFRFGSNPAPVLEMW